MLLDSVWNITDLGKNASKPFSSVLEALVVDMPKIPRSAHARNDKILLLILNTLAGSDLKLYVEKFLHDHPVN